MKTAGRGHGDDFVSRRRHHPAWTLGGCWSDLILTATAQVMGIRSCTEDARYTVGFKH